VETAAADVSVADGVGYGRHWECVASCLGDRFDLLQTSRQERSLE
jgi:hypothetical protein